MFAFIRSRICGKAEVDSSCIPLTVGLKTMLMFPCEDIHNSTSSQQAHEAL